MKTIIVSAGLLFVTLILPATGHATQATSAPCTPKRVIISAIVPINATVNNGGNNNANRYLSLNCNEGTFFIVYTNTANTTNVDTNNATGCFVDTDLMKMWESLSISAQLSGRTLTLQYQSVSLNGAQNNCPGTGTSSVIALVYQ